LIDDILSPILKKTNIVTLINLDKKIINYERLNEENIFKPDA